MPLYDVEHVISLSESQQEQIAKSFTSIHCQRFKTPSFFVNVRFTDASSQRVYRGGVLRRYNRAILRTRASENRSAETYGQHCRDIIEAWNKVLLGSSAEAQQALPEIQTLRAVWIMGALTTGVELGFQRPAAGKEIEWLQENKAEFERLADQGDEDMKSLVLEINTREDLADVISCN